MQYFKGCIHLSGISLPSGIEPPRRLHLQYLDLTDCPALENAGLKVIVRNNPQLAYLYLRRCVQITGKQKNSLISNKKHTLCF